MFAHRPGIPYKPKKHANVYKKDHTRVVI